MSWTVRLIAGLASSAARVTFIPVLHEPGSPESPFLYRDWMQYAWAVCYSLSCFSLGWYSPFPLTSPFFQSPPSWTHTPKISVPLPPSPPQKTFSYPLLHIKYTFTYPCSLHTNNIKNRQKTILNRKPNN